MNEDPDTIQLLMWIEKLEQKLSRLEREVIDIKSSLKKPAQNEMNEEIKSLNSRLAALETATRQLAGKMVR